MAYAYGNVNHTGSSASPEDVTRAVAFTAEVKNATLWHGRFGHVSLLNFKKVSGPNVEIPEDLGGDSNCQVCPLSKQTHISFPKEAMRAATEPFDTLHVDLLGPMDEVSFGGSRYAAVCVDECTRYVMVKPMELKSDFLATFQATMNEVRALGFQVRNLRTDYGGEFTSKTLKDFCQANSVLHTFAGPYAPQQMGIVERMNRTLTQIARSMLIQSGCPKEFWAEALNTAAYIVNRMPDEDGKSPFYKVFGRHPRIKHMRMFGCRAFVQLERHERSKLDPKARAGIFVGYDASNWRCYRVWDSATRRVRLSVHVSFIEHLFPMLEQAGLHPGGDQEHGYVETSSGDLTRAIEMHPAGRSRRTC